MKTEPQPPTMSEADRGSIRRTALAAERTELAWWRTGLTSLAVAVGIGRVVPELQESGATWPYAVLGIGFAAYGIALFVRGTSRGREEAGALSLAEVDHSRPQLLLAAAGPLLGVAVIALIAFT